VWVRAAPELVVCVICFGNIENSNSLIILALDYLMDYGVYTTDRFDKEMSKIPANVREQIWRLFEQLKINPYVEDQLQIRILREKRLREKRMYYLVFEDLKSVLVIAIGGKKAQQKVIDYIIENVENYREYLRGLI